MGGAGKRGDSRYGLVGMAPAATPARHPDTRPVDVCLVRSPTVTSIGAVGQDAVPPLGLAYIAGSLLAAGHRVSVVDGVGEAVHQYSRVPWHDRALMHGLRPEEIAERIDPRTEVVGIACMFSVEWLVVKRLIEAIHRALPHALVVLGGEHVTACPEYTLAACPEVAVGVLGEGEETMLDLLEVIAAGRDFAQVKGIVFRDEGRVTRAEPRRRIRAIDDIPRPAWSLFPVETYIDNALTHGANLGRCMPILASRGCPYQCTFCSSPQMWTTLWLARRPERVVAEMKEYMTRYRVTNFDFYDLTAIVRKVWILEFGALLLRENLRITWQLPSGTRSEAIDDEVSELLYRSGCRIVNYAPESGSPAELKRIKKKVDPARMIRSMRGAHRAGLQIKANFIFGLPDSSWRDVLNTFGFLARIAWAGVEDIGAFPFSPYPGSELFARLHERGRLRLDTQYFASLLAYTDPQHSVSYADFIGSRALAFVNILAMLYFYALSFLIRPQRLIKLAGAWLTRDSSTKLTMALANRRRKHLAMRLAKERALETVVIPPTYRPRDV